MKDFSQYLTNDQIVERAKQNLAQGPWDYLVGASESETTQRRNRLAFDKVAFRPRVLTDVTKIDTYTTFIGESIRIPVLLAPIGSLQVFEPEGGATVAKAAGEFGIMPVISSVTLPSLEETMASYPAPKIFQLYVDGDWDWIKSIIERVEKSGYKSLCITVDTAVYSRRERPMLSNWTPVSQRNPPDPKWRASLTWEIIDKIKSFTSLPLMLKGIATSEDALIAVEHKIDTIWVSNHGGRQLDYGRGTLDILPEVVDAANKKASIILDGGIQRGSDVVKAIAMGVDVVAIGKMQGWGLAAGGLNGLIRVLEILEDEIRVSMGLLGIRSFKEITKNHIIESDPVNIPHEMSSWVNKSKDRII
ncbi:MAG: alpha-hydroxy acid oxidase [Dehalococcoidia bacterium]